MDYLRDHLKRVMILATCLLAGCGHRQPADYDYANMGSPGRARQSDASETFFTGTAAAPSNEQSQDVDANTVLNFDDGPANFAYPPQGLWSDANQAMTESNGSTPAKPDHK